jgi:Ca2+-binding EF-hand superfamily protein
MVVTDTDGNGTYSMEEMKATYTDLTEDTFKAIDTNADGQIDADELKAAVAAGTLAG